MTLILTILLILFIGTESWAVTYWVAATGGSAATVAAPTGCTQVDGDADPGVYYRTINEAMPCLKTGDRMMIKSGTYTGAFTNPPNGTDGNHTIIESAGSPTNPVRYTRASAWNVYGGNMQYVTFKGVCQGDANSLDRECSMFWDGRTGSNIANNAPTVSSGHDIIFDGVRSAYWEPPVSSNFGVGADAYNITFRNCRSDHADPAIASPGDLGYYGWYLVTQNNITIENCEIDNNSGYGIQQRPDSPTTGTNFNIIRNNFVHDNGLSQSSASDGLMIYKSPPASPPIIECPPYCGTSNQGRNQIYGNVVFGNWGGGITINDGERDSVVYNNTIYGNQGNAGNGALAIGIGGASVINIAVKNNIVWGNTGQVLQIGPVASGTVLSNNLCTSGCTINGQNPLFVNAPGGNFNLTSPGSPAINAGTATITASISIPSCPAPSPHCYAGPAPDIGAFEVLAPPVITTNLVLALGFDEPSGTSVTDVSGRNNNGTFSTGVSRTSSGKYGGALSFNGTGGVSILNSASLNVSTGFSLMAWVKPSSLNPDSVIINKGQSMYYLFASLDYCGADNIVGGSIDGYACYGTPLITAPATWQHVTVTYSQATSQVMLYLNGKNVTTGSLSGAVPADSDPLTIGTSFYSEHFQGDIDEVRIYDGAIPEDVGYTLNGCLSAPSIVRDMNCSINPLIPPAAASGVKVSSTGGMTIGSGGGMTLGN